MQPKQKILLIISLLGIFLLIFLSSYLQPPQLKIQNISEEYINKEILLNVSITLLTEFPEKQFQIFKLKDESGEIKAITNSKVHLELNKSQIYLVTGKIQEYNNTLQLNINQIKLN